MLHYFTPLSTTLHYTTPLDILYTTLDHLKLFCTTLYHFTPFYTTLHYTTPIYTTLHNNLGPSGPQRHVRSFRPDLSKSELLPNQTEQNLSSAASRYCVVNRGRRTPQYSGQDITVVFSGSLSSPAIPTFNAIVICQ